MLQIYPKCEDKLKKEFLNFLVSVVICYLFKVSNIFYKVKVKDILGADR